ncbi:hypothetical protein P154DRAFT_140125 [Amniculicola lignicola CBS 123094]|uniref:DUF1275 domain protein n=1 Tax=Amniculicola lignicola CBS 123094 TaxID=1392246 RepID=A0A6A5WLC0_9PLEO|nr:hypothetical protein P154DRAFT_140125 [Amniculicola lignicola CBS 123094]
MSSLPACREASGRGPDEETPLLAPARKPRDGLRPWTTLQNHMTQTVSKDWADSVLLFCYIITGLLDSAAVFIWGSFVSMQTGNTVYFGLGVTQPKADIRWVKALVSISFFCLGSFFFSHFHRLLTQRKRWVLVAAYTLQFLLVSIAALIATIGNDSTNGLHWQVLIPIASLAFQSSGQAVTSRVMQFGGLTSVVLTSNYCDLFSDPKLFHVSNVERNRRIAAPLLLLFGAILGGFWAHSETGLKGALWSAAVLKSLVVGAWLVWKADPEE